MSNDNKKAWLTLIVPVVFMFLLFSFPGMMDNFIVFVMAFFILIIIQFYFTKFLNKKFPSSGDLKD